MEAELVEGDEPCPVNLTNHTYFNLSGHKEMKSILEHDFKINADFYLENDEDSIPTKEIKMTPEYDFRERV